MHAPTLLKRMCACMPVQCACSHTHANTHMHTHTHVHAHMHTHAPTHLHTPQGSLTAYLPPHMNEHTHTHAHTHTHPRQGSLTYCICHHWTESAGRGYLTLHCTTVPHSAKWCIGARKSAWHLTLQIYLSDLPFDIVSVSHWSCILASSNFTCDLVDIWVIFSHLILCLYRTGHVFLLVAIGRFHMWPRGYLSDLLSFDIAYVSH